MATRETPGGAGGPGRWSRAPEDLGGDAALRAASRVEFEGRNCPSVGKIALLARLGRGGMGVVYYGVHPRLGTEVAVKLLPADAVDRDKEAVDRFVREARLAARLRSDHLVAVIDVDRDEPTGAHFIVMEYIRGVTAGKLLREAEARGQKGLPESVALDLCIAATRGLVAAHVEGVLHRDIKPDNVLVPIGPGGEPLHARAKLADLGLARKETGDEGITVSHIAMGTPGYMAPEQARDARSARKPADVFSVGATLYALLCGEPPFRGATAMDTILRTMNGEFHSIRVLRKDVSDATTEFLERCLAKDPHERFPDAPAVLEALEICRSSLRETGAPADTRGRIQGLVRRKEQGKRVVSDPLATPTPPAVPDDASAVAAPVAAVPRPHHAAGAPRRGAAGRKKGSPALLAAAGALVLAAVAAFLVLRGGSGPPAGLHVDSTPQGARVILDGGVVGTTPHFVAGLSGRHTVRLELDGHEPFQSADVVVAAGERRELRPVLARAAVEEGLEISCEPDGASVSVDGRPSGKVVGGVALHVPGLAYGTHTVKVTLASYEPYSRDVVVRKGEKTAVRAVLQRATNGLVVTNGAPGAKVRLDRVGQPAKRYEWTFDDDGRVAVAAVEAGEYRAECEHPSFQPWSSRVVVPAEGAPPTVVAGMREHDGTLRVHSRPPGADVLVDGRAIGKTPVAGAGLPAGERAVELRLADHGPVKTKVRIRGQQVHDLGIVEMPPFGTLDLSQLPADVVVREGKEVLANGLHLAPGARKLVLERPGHAPHEVAVAVEAGKPAVVLPAKPWEQFQARLDLSSVELGTKVFVDGNEVGEAGLGWGADREVSVSLRRPGFEPVTVRVAVKVGAATPLPAVGWRRIQTTLDLSDLAFGVTVDGKSGNDGQALAPGPHRIQFGRDKWNVTVDWQRAVRPPIWSFGGGTTRLALDWLAKHQSPDGRWDCDGFAAQCKLNKCSGPGEAVHDPGVTGLALSAFLGAGETTRDGPHKDTVAAAIRFLHATQDQEGCFGPRTSEKFQYNHAISAAAMCDAYRLTGDADFRESAQLGVNFVHQSQNPYLAWRYGVRDSDNDTSVTFWMCRALRAGQRAELAVDKGAWTGALAWVDKMTEPEFGKTGYQQRGGPPWRTPQMAQKFPADQSESLTAAACLLRLWAGTGPKSEDWEFVQKGAWLLQKRLPWWDVDRGNIDFYYWHLGTQVTQRVGGDTWKRWRDPLFEALVNHQRLEVDRDERGSWDPEDPWALEGGRVYSTAINCLTVQTLGR